MTIAFNDTIRTARMQAVADAINAGAAGGKIKIYDGAQPAKGGAATTLLATLTFSATCEASITAGVLTFAAITDDTSADATGTATWARITDSDDTFVYDCTVGTGGTDIILNSAAIQSGATVSITSASITDGNA